MLRRPGWRPRVRTEDSYGWLEIRCSLFPQPQPPGRFVPWAALSEALEGWRAERRYQWCFFVRKPPGLRLRFAGAHLARDLEPVLLPWLAAAERSNDLRGYRFTTYEAEEARFGGAVGMAIAHDHFDADSRTALRYEALSDETGEPLDRYAFSAAVCSDLISATIDDRAEVWDVWQRLDRAVAPHVSSRSAAHDEVQAEPPALGELGDAERALLEYSLETNARIAEALVAAAEGGRLTVGVRAWLTAAILFHWNRLGLGLAPDRLGAMVSALGRISEP